MALGATALTTLAKLKTRLGITVSTFDTQLEDAINAASESIVGFLGVEALHYAAAATEKVRAYGTPWVTLHRPPIWSITSVTIEGETIDSDLYVIEDAKGGLIRRDDGWLWTSRMRGEGVVRDPLPGHEAALYLFTFAGGWQTPAQTPIVGVDALPADIERAALMTSAWMFLTDGADPTASSESLLSYSISRADASTALGDAGLPIAVEKLLASRRFVLQI